MPKRPAANFDFCCPAGTDALAFGLGLGLPARFTPQGAQNTARHAAKRAGDPKKAKKQARNVKGDDSPDGRQHQQRHHRRYLRVGNASAVLGARARFALPSERVFFFPYFFVSHGCSPLLFVVAGLQRGSAPPQVDGSHRSASGKSKSAFLSLQASPRHARLFFLFYSSTGPTMAMPSSSSALGSA